MVVRIIVNLRKNKMLDHRKSQEHNMRNPVALALTSPNLRLYVLAPEVIL